MVLCWSLYGRPLKEDEGGDNLCMQSISPPAYSSMRSVLEIIRL